MGLMSTFTTTPEYNDDDDDAVFTHHFSGWSVWLEPSDDDVRCEPLKQIMHTLRQSSYPTECEQDYAFPLHATVLYNFNSEKLGTRSSTTADTRHRAHGLLQDCRTSLERSGHLSSSGIALEPKAWGTLDYPKTADEGKGFGAAIGYLLIHGSEALTSVHDCVRQAFPTDERGSAFAPHLSLVYAPRQSLTMLSQRSAAWQSERYLFPGTATATDLRATRLSVWSTIGPTKDWYRIASVSLALREENKNDD